MAWGDFFFPVKDNPVNPGAGGTTTVELPGRAEAKPGVVVFASKPIVAPEGFVLEGTKGVVISFVGHRDGAGSVLDPTIAVQFEEVWPHTGSWVSEPELNKVVANVPWNMVERQVTFD